MGGRLWPGTSRARRPVKLSDVTEPPGHSSPERDLELGGRSPARGRFRRRRRSGPGSGCSAGRTPPERRPRAPSARDRTVPRFPRQCSRAPRDSSASGVALTGPRAPGAAVRPGRRGPAPDPAAGEAQSVEPRRVVLLHAGRQDLPLPGGTPRTRAFELLQQGVEALRTFRPLVGIDPLPGEEESQLVALGDRLDLRRKRSWCSDERGRAAGARTLLLAVAGRRPD